LKNILLHTREFLLSDWFEVSIRVALAVLFVYGGAMKLSDPTIFAKALSAYDLVPEQLLPVVAVGLPAVEVLAGFALILNIREGLIVISGLLGLFILVLGYGIYSDLSIDCGCFGPGEIIGRNTLRQAFYRDLVLIGAATYLHVSRRLRARQLIS
jgi:uncharacterized membrane protein YphA (DoxX/SURF4 family)